ncbi:prostate stem cell antigen-like isoform X1 [Polyodon spathula]|uniref:prostate stem cell antigen-like isoform X1 n=1 Tax=Polyodon spathula TaxID=7913 RepID=UPI001B7E6959|nr:prostate stem cell antigen-like isoform X1 [Polyodon spathula]
MRAEITILLLVCFGICEVEALTCYQCTTAFSNTDCNSKIQTCYSESKCKTSVTTVMGITAYNKGCAQDRECSESGNLVYIGVYGSRVQCCSSSLCNVNGAAHARLTLQLLGFSAALLYLVGMVTV